MTPTSLTVLAVTAMTVAVIHTLLGPDHYLPFVMMARARDWSRRKTAIITALCGTGHVVSSIALGAVGLLLGTAASRLAWFESARGEFAAWLLVLFGLLYALWGLRQAQRGKTHSHWHQHSCGATHDHDHTHAAEHAHAHEAKGTRTITPWILFTIFVFGPCEPLIPLLFAAFSTAGSGGFILVASLFGAVTIITMTSVALLALAGVKAIPLGFLERQSHTFAGTAICLCGLSILFLGL